MDGLDEHPDEPARDGAPDTAHDAGDDAGRNAEQNLAQTAGPSEGDDTVHDYGDRRVDAAVSRTDGLDDRPVADHVEVYDEVHRSFRETLDDPESSASGA